MLAPSTVEAPVGLAKVVPHFFARLHQHLVDDSLGAVLVFELSGEWAGFVTLHPLRWAWRLLLLVVPLILLLLGILPQDCGVVAGDVRRHVPCVAVRYLDGIFVELLMPLGPCREVFLDEFQELLADLCGHKTICV